MGGTSRFDLATPWGRFKAYWEFVWRDHAFLRLAFRNERWIGENLVRTNQPWPFQLEQWRDRGVRTVINLRGQSDASFHALEEEACARLGLKLVSFPVRSHRALTCEQVMAAKAMFESIEYPALIHCKSGADRVGVMSALYCHLQLGEPVEAALEQLSARHLHIREARAGVLSHMFRRYIEEGRAAGLSFLEWISGPTYCPQRLKAEFRPQWWGMLITEGVIRRE